MATVALNSGAVWADNWALASTVTDDSGMAVKSNYPLTNLNNPLRSSLTKWTWSESASLTVTFTLPAAKVVTAIALIDTNFSDITGTPTNTFSFTCQTNPSNFGVWNLKRYATQTGVQRYYLGSPDSTTGTMPTSNGSPYSTIYKLTFNPNSWGNYGISELSLGGVVLSAHNAVDIASGATLNTQSGTRQAAAFSGAVYQDILPSFASGQFNVGPYSQNDNYTFLQSLSAWGSQPQIVDLHASSASTDSGATSTSTNNSAAYYAVVGSELLASTSLTSGQDNRPSLSFIETRG